MAQLMRPTRMSYADLVSIVDGCAALKKLHRCTLVLNIPPTWHSLSMALSYLHGKVRARKSKDPVVWRAWSISARGP